MKYLVRATQDDREHACKRNISSYESAVSTGVELAKMISSRCYRNQVRAELENTGYWSDQVGNEVRIEEVREPVSA